MEAANDGIENGLVLDLIRAACAAGRLSVGVREHPDAAAGLEKAREFHSRRVMVLADRILAQPGLDGPGAAPALIHRRGVAD